MIVKTEEEYDSLKNKTPYTFFCKSCGKETQTTKDTWAKVQESQKKFLCKQCKTKLTCLEKYGGVAPACSKQVLGKMKETFKEKFGVENPMQSEKVKEKSKETCKQKYGVEYFSQTESFLDKREQTYLENYGVDNPAKNKEVQKKISEGIKEAKAQFSEERKKEIAEKFKETCLEKYEVENYTQTEEARILLSNLQKQIWANKTEEEKLALSQKQKEVWESKSDKKKQGIIRKIKETWKAKTFEERQSIKRKSNKFQAYKSFDGEVFDSLWELRYYEYCKSQGLTIIREPVGLQYEYNGDSHLYYPDFSVNGQLVEVKGNHLKDSEGKWICPFKQKDKDPEYMNGLYEAKRQCAIRNNVTILYGEDLESLGIKLN